MQPSPLPILPIHFHCIQAPTHLSCRIVSALPYFISQSQCQAFTYYVITVWPNFLHLEISLHPFVSPALLLRYCFMFLYIQTSVPLLSTIVFGNHYNATSLYLSSLSLHSVLLHTCFAFAFCFVLRFRA